MTYEKIMDYYKIKGGTNMSNLIRTAVLDRRTKENSSIDFGDFDRCYFGLFE